MFLERVYTPGLAHFSYVLGGGGAAAVIDPQRDFRIYMSLADEHEARITHIFETHRNEDFLTGSLGLSQATGAQILHGAQIPFRFGRPVKEGDSFQLGDIRLDALHTPGHSDESISLALAHTASGSDPIGVFTGDALFVGSVGRSDFYPNRMAESARLQYDSIFRKLLPLGDGVLLYPAHGAGSVCGSRMLKREFSTLGYERKHNPMLQMNRDEFIRHKLDEKLYMPPYFHRMDKLNLEGPPLDWPYPAPCSPDEFADAIQHGCRVVDVRSSEACAGASIPGSISLPVGLLAGFAGWFLPYDHPIALISESPRQAQEATVRLARMGYDSVRAWLAGGMEEWNATGRPFQTTPVVHAAELRRRIDDGEEFYLLDVRTSEEFEQKHLPGAVNVYLGELPEFIDELPEERPIVTICSTGQRSMCAASLLMKHGIDWVEECLGSMAAVEALEKAEVEMAV